MNVLYNIYYIYIYNSYIRSIVIFKIQFYNLNKNFSFYLNYWVVRKVRAD